ncbi:hypothetical protein BSL78_06917 [Apostichopus japonicus]|uniref:Uncharacterized protein n=1 Tax=Stichopus japonicus TaxID=307972 RepID=A0A2G8L7C8_STIJA|nr:hypothetical protein BSL78_06917 [Apostichopus japonicus]
MAAEKEDKRQTRVFLWAWPRSISTAVEKCLSFVEGVQTWHEPYTVPNIFELLDKADKGKESSEVTAMMTQYKEMLLNAGKEPNEFSNSRFMPISKFNYPFVKDQLEQEEPGKQYIFIKDMAAAILNHMDALPDGKSPFLFLSTAMLLDAGEGYGEPNVP